MPGEGEEGQTTDQLIRRRVGRSIVNGVLAVAAIAIVAVWVWTGLYRLEPGEAAVVLRLGAYDRTQLNPGLHWHLPRPLEAIQVVNVTQIRREKFGGLESGKTPQPGESTAGFESAIQTADSNIVNLSYVVQYRVADAFAFVYAMAFPEATLRDAAQASVREVVGRKSVDAVLSDERAAVEMEAREILDQTLTDYFSDRGHESAFQILRVSLQVVQPPVQVQEAFDDVVSARQDEERALSEAQGDAREIIERATAVAREMLEQANGYRDAKIVEATGESARFEALLTEYLRAPEVTRRRLYLETMEEVMPGVETVVIEPNTVNLMPFLPLQRNSRPPVGAGPPAASQEGVR